MGCGGESASARGQVALWDEESWEEWVECSHGGLDFLSYASDIKPPALFALCQLDSARLGHHEPDELRDGAKLPSDDDIRAQKPDSSRISTLWSEAGAQGEGAETKRISVTGN